MPWTKINKFISSNCLTFLTALTFFINAHQTAALPLPKSCRIFTESASWTFVDRAERANGDQFVQLVMATIDYAHPYGPKRLFAYFRSPKAISVKPDTRGPDATLIAQLSRMQQLAWQKRLTRQQIATIKTHVVAALDGFGGNGLGRKTGKWVLGNRTPLGISDVRIQDLQKREHDYMVFVFRDWDFHPTSTTISGQDLIQQLDFTTTIRNAKDKVELYLESIENASKSLNEEGYMTFAVRLAGDLTPELAKSKSLSTSQVLTILRSLRATAANKYFLESTLSDGNNGFAFFKDTIRNSTNRQLWTDPQAKDLIEEFLTSWEEEIKAQIYQVKKQYLTRMRPLTDEEVVALKAKFEKKMVSPYAE
jgi:hypothetical protein